jgi:hypothetical protein
MITFLIQLYLDTSTMDNTISPEDVPNESPPKAKQAAPSSYNHFHLPESCSGLRDQFLRIKELFTKPAIAPDIPVTVPVDVVNASAQQSVIDIKKDRRRLTVDFNAGWIDPRQLLDPDRNQEIGMKPMELVHELDKLNADAKVTIVDIIKELLFVKESFFVCRNYL